MDFFFKQHRSLH